MILINSLNSWHFNDPKLCTGKVKTGRLSNVHPEATTLINPELAT